MRTWHLGKDVWKVVRMTLEIYCRIKLSWLVNVKWNIFMDDGKMGVVNLIALSYLWYLMHVQKGRESKNKKLTYIYFISLMSTSFPFLLIYFVKSISILLSPLSSVQSLSCVQLFATPWAAVHQASLSITNSRSLLKLLSIESMMPSKHFILCHPLLLRFQFFPASGSFPMSWFFASGHHTIKNKASLVAQLVKNPPAMQETWVQSLGWENPLEKRKATCQ